MSAFGLKGGIGTASRRALAGVQPIAVGVLALSNFGQLHELVIAGRPIGAWLAAEEGQRSGEPCGGSVIVVIATDAPLSSRQLKRLLHRAQNGLARTGSATAHYSGEIVIGFTSAARIVTDGEDSSHALRVLREESAYFDPLFQAVTEATEEAVLNSLFNARTITGHNGASYAGFPIERLPELMGRPIGA
jgi:D-aminopeptidase